MNDDVCNNKDYKAFSSQADTMKKCVLCLRVKYEGNSISGKNHGGL